MARTNNLINFLTDVASAIKEKKGSETAIQASQFDTEIRNLPSQGVYEQKTINISANGTQTIVPDTDYDAIDELTINTAVPEKQLQSKTYNFTQNATLELEPDSGYDGFNKIGLTIDVQGEEPDPTTADVNDVISPKTFYSNGQKLTGAIIPKYEPTDILLDIRQYNNNIDNSSNILCSNRDGYIIQSNNTTLYLYKDGQLIKNFGSVLASNNCHGATLSDIYTDGTNTDMILFWPYGTYNGIPTCKYYSLRYVDGVWSCVDLSCSFPITSSSYWANGGYGLYGKFVTTSSGKYMVLIGGGNGTAIRAVNVNYIPYVSTSITFSLCNLYYSYGSGAGNVNTRELIQLDAFCTDNDTVIINYFDKTYKAMIIANFTLSSFIYHSNYSSTYSGSFLNSRYLINENRYIQVTYSSNTITCSLYNRNNSSLLSTMTIPCTSSIIIPSVDKNNAFYLAVQYGNKYITYCISYTNDTLSLVSTHTGEYVTQNRTSTKMMSNDYGCRAYPKRNSILEYYNTTTNEKLVALTRLTNVYTLLDPLVSTPTDNVLNNNTYYDGSGRRVGTMPNNGSVTYTPSTSQQNIASGYHNGSIIKAVTNSIDINIIPENIRNGVTILGIEGIFEGSQGGDATSDGNLQAKYLLEGYSAVVDGQLIQGNMKNYGAKTITATSNDIEIPEGFYTSLSIPIINAANCEDYTECNQAILSI